MRYFFAILLLMVFACKSKHKSKDTTSALYHPSFNPGPHVMVYKTSGDYQNNVPVLLSDDGNDIISYPHPNDIKATEMSVMPTGLKNGYLIDNRGISTKAAFLKLTYSEYAKLDTVPSLATLKSWIIAKNAITELCDCGDKNGYTNLEKQINAIIEQDSLRTICRKIL